MFEPKYKNYRVCYDNGNSKTGTKLFELYKYCKCEGCQRRLRYRRLPSNRIVITTTDITKVDDIADFLKNWTCADGDKMLEPVYVRWNNE